ncbi:MAG: hypothetical protein L0I76_08420 [Pseudonocardia sp.]|nr:hypothetical protein [Pseudonocardia sp.]
MTTNETDTSDGMTVRERLAAAGLSEQRVAMHLENKVLQIDGQTVTDLDQPAPAGSRINIAGS